MNSINASRLKEVRTKMALIISLVKELKHVKGLFATGLFLLLLATAGAQLAPLLLQNIIDNDLTQVSKGLVLN